MNLTANFFPATFAALTIRTVELIAEGCKNTIWQVQLCYCACFAECCQTPR